MTLMAGNLWEQCAASRVVMLIMIVRRLLTAAAFLLASGLLFAQNEFQLPRECRERQLADPQKCVIQDGLPPRLPWLHPVPARPGTAAIVTPPPANATAAQPPAFRKVPQR